MEKSIRKARKLQSAGVLALSVLGLLGDATLANADGEGGACYIKIIREHSITTVCHQASLVGCNRIVSQVRDAVRSSWEIGERCNPLRETSVRR